MKSVEGMKEYYNHKTILITGATGFVGKAILWHLLKVAGKHIEKVYVLIRPKRISAGSPSQRILDEIINIPVKCQKRNKKKDKNKISNINKIKKKNLGFQQVSCRLF